MWGAGVAAEIVCQREEAGRGLVRNLGVELSAGRVGRRRVPPDAHLPGTVVAREGERCFDGGAFGSEGGGHPATVRRELRRSDARQGGCVTERVVGEAGDFGW